MEYLEIVSPADFQEHVDVPPAAETNAAGDRALDVTACRPRRN